jgi:hypothetical protein
MGRSFCELGFWCIIGKGHSILDAINHAPTASSVTDFSALSPGFSIGCMPFDSIHEVIGRPRPCRRQRPA